MASIDALQATDQPARDQFETRAQWAWGSSADGVRAQVVAYLRRQHPMRGKRLLDHSAQAVTVDAGRRGATDLGPRTDRALGEGEQHGGRGEVEVVAGDPYAIVVDHAAGGRR